MQKKIGAIMLVAGTCIGSGMVALPIVLVKFGLILSIILMIITWALMYYTSLVNLELNLYTKLGKTLGELCKIFSGRFAELLANVCLKLLSYSLLAAFLFAAGCVTQYLLISILGINYSTITLITAYSIGAIFYLLLPIKLIDYTNRLLFIAFLLVFATLMTALLTVINLRNLPLTYNLTFEISDLFIVLPIIFTSFGFQVIFHTIANYCENDAKMLKATFLYGSLIPAIIYIIWTCGVLSVIYDKNPNFYYQMLTENIQVGEMVRELSYVAKWYKVQLLIWWISILAIISSILGVGIGLVDNFKVVFSRSITNLPIRTVCSSAITIVPSYILAIYLPNAFITMLGFAGMILVIIAVLLPAYLLYKAKISVYNYSELNNKWLLVLSILLGILIIICEIMNLFHN